MQSSAGHDQGSAGHGRPPPPAPVPGGVWMWIARAEEWVLGSLADMRDSASAEPEAKRRPQKSSNDKEADAGSSEMPWQHGMGSSSSYMAPEGATEGHSSAAPERDAWEEEAEDVHEVEGGRAFRRQPCPVMAKVGIDIGGVVLRHQPYSWGPPVLVPYCKHVLQMLASCIGGENIHFITTVGRAYTYEQTLTSLTDLGILDILVPARNVHPTECDTEKAAVASSLKVTLMVDDRANVLRECAKINILGLLFSRNGDAMSRWQNFRSFHDLVRQVDNWVAVWQIMQNVLSLPEQVELPMPFVEYQFEAAGASTEAGGASDH